MPPNTENEHEIEAIYIAWATAESELSQIRNVTVGEFIFTTSDTGYLSIQSVRQKALSTEISQYFELPDRVTTEDGRVLMVPQAIRKKSFGLATSFTSRYH